MTDFTLRGRRVLAVGLAGESVRARNGSMVAYTGSMNFKRLTGGGEGLRGSVSRRLTGEKMTMMEVSGHGTCYLAQDAAEINIVRLTGGKLHVESDNLLATESSLRTGTGFTGLRGAARSQGLFTTTVEGTGLAAIISEGAAVALRVAPEHPLLVDPGAYLAHSGELRQEYLAAASWRTVIGEGSGETVQVRFSGHGVVYVQPAERRTLAGDL